MGSVISYDLSSCRDAVHASNVIWGELTALSLSWCSRLRTKPDCLCYHGALVDYHTTKSYGDHVPNIHGRKSVMLRACIPKNSQFITCVDFFSSLAIYFTGSELAKYRGRRNNSKNILAKGDLIRFIRLGYRRRYTLRINIAIAFRNDDNRVVLLRQRPCDKML